MKRTYTLEILKALLKNDFLKVDQIEREALIDYSNTITNSVMPINVTDMPFLIAALECVSENFKKEYPHAIEYADLIKNKFDVNSVTVSVNKEELDKVLGGNL